MKEPSLDCVKMKASLQRKLLKEWSGLSLEERRKDMRTKALRDPIVGPWLHRVQQAAVHHVQEPPSRYVAKRSHAK